MLVLVPESRAVGARSGAPPEAPWREVFGRVAAGGIGSWAWEVGDSAGRAGDVDRAEVRAGDVSGTVTWLGGTWRANALRGRRAGVRADIHVGGGTGVGNGARRGVDTSTDVDTRRGEPWRVGTGADGAEVDNR
ncbi:hypothetical protein GCM10010428_55910 [Actinosynnema pretiosum subsp. pretiosum]